MLHYVDNVLTPYLTGTRAQLGLLPDQIALKICDVFAAHRCESLLENLQQTMSKSFMYQLGAQETCNPLMSL